MVLVGGFYGLFVMFDFFITTVPSIFPIQMLNVVSKWLMLIISIFFTATILVLVKDIFASVWRGCAQQASCEARQEQLYGCGRKENG
jgi:hypothetical protein